LQDTIFKKPENNPILPMNNDEHCDSPPIVEVLGFRLIGLLCIVLDWFG
jgi:hypothetical protein